MPQMDKTMNYRAVTVAQAAGGTPSTLNETSRSVEVIGATENPVPTYDWQRGEIIDEVILMSGCQMPENKQLPLLDTHMRMDTSGVIGSFREMSIKDSQLVGRAFFSETPEAQSPYQKVREGHLTDFSIGYKVLESTYIPDGQRQEINGRSFTGPVKVATNWTPRELSVCPIGADEYAKARALNAESVIAKEAKNMDTKIRAFLESKGLPAGATEEEAYKFLEGLDTRAQQKQQSAAAETVNSIDEAVRVERERALEIRAMGEYFSMADLADEHIKKGTSVEEARKSVLDKLIAASPKPVFRGQVEVIETERDKFRDAAADSILIRSGVKIEKPAAGAERFAGYSLRELSREALALAKQPTDGDAMRMIGRALTTSDLPNILANVANKSLSEGYETASETWQTWCATGSVSDFKTHTLVRASETEDLDEIVESAEYKHGAMSDTKEEYRIVTYGKLFAISRQAIINDDLAALTDIPRKHGESASRKIGDIAYAVLTANAAMGDGIALFHASHANLGTAGVVSETTIAEAIRLMKLQKDIGGRRRLNINPIFFIAPVALEGSAEVFFNSKLFAGANTAATRENQYAGNRFTRIYEPRLDDTSATSWYLAGPKGKTVTVFFLNGNQTPYLETRQGWNVDGVEYKIRIDAGAKALDWKALVRNAGA